MQNIVLNETENTPYVNFDFEKGFFELKGVSKLEVIRNRSSERSILGRGVS